MTMTESDSTSTVHHALLPIGHVERVSREFGKKALEGCGKRRCQ